jgi:hypothetical protein
MLSISTSFGRKKDGWAVIGCIPDFRRNLDSVCVGKAGCEFPARMYKVEKSQRIIRQVGVQAYRDSSTASI